MSKMLSTSFLVPTSCLQRKSWPILLKGSGPVKALLHCCSNNGQTNSSSQTGPESFDSMGHDFLWKHFQGHYGCKGVLKFYHHGTTYNILSETGVQQGDPLGSVLFALGNHSSLVNIACLYQSLLVAGYADNCFLLGPLKNMSKRPFLLSKRL